MKEILEKLKGYEEAMAREKGPFDLFGLFLRDDAPDKWDLLLAADWIERNKEESFRYIIDMVQEGLSKEELLKLSRIVLINEKNAALGAMYKAIGGGRNIEIKDSNFFGLQIRHAYLITLRKRSKSEPNKPINSDA
jgi:hypothetical protein